MLKSLQKLGKSLMLPVATLPAAGILQGLGLLNYEKDIPLGPVIGGFLNQYVVPFLNEGAGAIFGNLALIFAIGVAIGLAGDAVAALSALIAYMVLTRILGAVPGVFGYIPDDVKLDMGVLGGIFAGLLAAYMYKNTIISSFLTGSASSPANALCRWSPPAPCWCWPSCSAWSGARFRMPSALLAPGL